MYIRRTYSADIADMERMAGRCVIAAKNADEASMSIFYGGAGAALYTLLNMENGMDEEAFATMLLNWWTGVPHE